MNPICKAFIHKQRMDFEKLSSAQHFPSSVLDGVREERNICYSNDGAPDHVMDLYCPETVVTPTPVVIHIHGGGFTTGSKDLDRHFCINLCKMGFLVFSLEYRKYPEVTVYRQLEDIYTAMNCIDGMMLRLKAQPGHCYMAGDEAGAMLALYAAAIQRNPRLAEAAGIRPSYLEISLLALVSGRFYTRKLDLFGLLMQKVLYGQNYHEHPFYPFLNPNREEVSLYLPPCFLTTSKHDILRSQSYNLTNSIRQWEGCCILFDYGNAPELTCAFPVLAPELSESKRVIEDISYFFRENE